LLKKRRDFCSQRLSQGVYPFAISLIVARLGKKSLTKSPSTAPISNAGFGLRIFQQKSSTSKPLPSMMLFNVPMGMGLFPCMETNPFPSGR
jgi:hypothetical protein